MGAANVKKTQNTDPSVYQNASYYSSRHEKTKGTAEYVLGILPDDLLEGSHVLDMGCGVGTWGLEATNRGATRISCVDGDWVDRNVLEISRDCFHPVDLCKDYPPKEEYDLAIWLENAEHLPVERGKQLIAWLSQHCDWVLFSAAIPGQGGTGHINEQWQSWWAKEFIAQQYSPYDYVRPKIWCNDKIPSYYRQNIVLYIKDDCNIDTSYFTPVNNPKLLNRVHYDQWKTFIRHPGVRYSIRLLIRSLIYVFKRQW